MKLLLKFIRLRNSKMTLETQREISRLEQLCYNKAVYKSEDQRCFPCCKIGECQTSVVIYINYVNKYLSPLWSMPIFKMIWQEMFENNGHIHVYSKGVGP